MTRVVVLGGGLAGVLAAKVFARHADEVVLVEGGRYPAAVGVRPGLPQAFHSHLLVAGGARALDTLLPGTVEALLDHGAHRRDLPGDALILSAQGWFRRRPTGAYLISCSRWLTDWVVRRRALAGSTTVVRDGTRVLGLTGDASRVTGVVVSPGETIPADVVVDATGRRSRAAQWLAAIGAGEIEQTTVDPGLAYATRLYRAPAGATATIPAVLIHPRPGDEGPGNEGPGNGATLFPIEGDRWIVTLTGARAPADEAGFAARVSGLPTPVIGELIAAATPIGPVRPFRGTTNRRRHHERGPRPDGFLVLGDALAAVNPVYSHGMSVAALSVLRLAGELHRYGADPAACPDLQTAMAQEAEQSWRMAVEQDRPTRAPTAFEREIRTRMARSALTSPGLTAAMFRSQMLLPPGTPGIQGHDGPPPSTDEAIAQYPELAAWWRPARAPV